MGERTYSIWGLALLAAVSGALLAVCFPPYGLYPLAWVALVPLLAALARVRRARQGAGLGLVTGLVLFGSLHRYLLMYGGLPTFLVALFQALPVALFGALAVPLSAGKHPMRRALALAAAWVLCEWLRANLGGLSLTIGQLGYTQQPVLPLLQFASLAGALGVSFLVVLVNAALAGALFPARPERGRWAAAFLIAVLMGAVWLWGAAVLRRPLPTGAPLNVAVVQPNVPLHTPVTPEDEQLCLVAYPRWTDLLLAPYGDPASPLPGRPQLVVWPETAFPVALNLQADFEAAAREAARRHHVWLLMGALQVEGMTDSAAFDPPADPHLQHRLALRRRGGAARHLQQDGPGAFRRVRALPR